jgi:hypothetical protein
VKNNLLSLAMPLALLMSAAAQFHSGHFPIAIPFHVYGLGEEHGSNPRTFTIRNSQGNLRFPLTPTYHGYS